MKIVNFYILITFFTLCLFSCSSNDPNSTEDYTTKNLAKPPMCNFGWMMWKDQFPGMDITSLGPNGEGWKSIALHVHSNLYSNAISQGYYPKIAIITREKAVAGLPTYNMDRDANSIFTEIEHAKLVGADWVMIDDGLTIAYTHTLHPDSINKYKISFNDMCRLGLKADEQGLKLAVSEDCKTVFSHPYYYISQNWELYDYVDIIMPYGYDRTVSELHSFYSWINAHNKIQVPFLGYHVVKEGSYRYQTKAYIDNALAYSDIIYYYLDGDIELDQDNFLPYLNQLTTYLQTNNYISGNL